MKGILVAFLFFPFLVQAQGLNAGLIQGVWYSETSFFAGDTVRIYTAIQNNSGADIEGTIAFLVSGEEIGRQAFSALKGRIVEAWADWQAAEGTHAVSAQITEAVKKEIGKDPEPITLDSLAAPADSVTVDLDTDGDDIGNSADEDDDNDGFKDKEETVAGTDPLDAASFQELAQEEQREDGQETPSPLTEFAKKVTDEYLGIGNIVDKKAGETAADFQAQREALAVKKITEPPTNKEIATDWLLASAITALPEWRFGLFAFFGLSLAFLARKLGGNQD